MRRLGLMLLFAVVIRLTAAAQETTGTITGVTTDSTGGVLPGVTVTLKSVNTGAVRSVVTNEAGIYIASGLSSVPTKSPSSCRDSRAPPSGTSHCTSTIGCRSTAG